VIYLVPSHMTKWFAANKFALNLDTTEAMKFITYNASHFALCIDYNEKCIEETVNMKFLGVQIDNHLNWKNYIKKTISRFRGAHYALRSMIILVMLTLKSIYYTYFHSVIKYGLIILDNPSISGKTFTLQHKIVRIMDLWLLAFCDHRPESCQGRGSLCLVSVMRCKVEVTASGLSLIQRNSTYVVSLSVITKLQ
jgi:hypothetical protein